VKGVPRKPVGAIFRGNQKERGAKRRCELRPEEEKKKESHQGQRGHRRGGDLNSKTRLDLGNTCKHGTPRRPTMKIKTRTEKTWSKERVEKISFWAKKRRRLLKKAPSSKIKEPKTAWSGKKTPVRCPPRPWEDRGAGPGTGECPSPSSTKWKNTNGEEGKGGNW